MIEIATHVILLVAVVAMVVETWMSRRQVDRALELLSARSFGEYTSGKVALHREKHKDRPVSAEEREDLILAARIAVAQDDPYSQG